MNEPTSDVSKVFLKARKAQPFFGRHPWVFESAIDAVETSDGQEPQPGTVVELFSDGREFIARGLWNSNSRIRVRLYTWDSDRQLDDAFWKQRIDLAVSFRQRFFDLQSSDTACRVVFSESDQLSGLTVDSYCGWLVVQFTSRALWEYREPILSALRDRLTPKGIWLRTEKGMREAEGLEVVDGLIEGDDPPRPLFFTENDIRYGVDLQTGQKTGGYLDQRDNRLLAARYATGRMLDAFCFSGGFGMTALRHGIDVRHVTAVDSSESALQLAAANADLNDVARHFEFVRSDVRLFLEGRQASGESFDTVVLDPPKMARTRGGLGRALKGYERLNRLAVDLLNPGGVLVTCSCSGLLDQTTFQEMLASVARTSRRHIQFLEVAGQPADHPVSASCPETAYLKMLICRVN